MKNIARDEEDSVTDGATGMTARIDQRFLMLQGPHGPFLSQLGRMLRKAGAEVWRVGFNRGDELFWRGPGYIPWLGRPEDWPAEAERLIRQLGITDLVVYGDARPIHAQAIAIARARGVTVHVFEEGYLRPYWVTYERGGSNGNSRLTRIGLDQIRNAVALCDREQPRPPARWGDMRQHMFYGALYHFAVMALNRRYRNFRPHRGISVTREFRLYLRGLLLAPLHAMERRVATWRVKRGGFPYHLVLLQLEHDSSFQAHSDLRSMTEFVDLCLDAFARGAPGHHHIVFKAHPLEDDRAAIAQHLRRRTRDLGLDGRVHFIRGGKLAPLMDSARSAVTVNSTAGQQALWRGLPLRSFGRAVYNFPEFVSSQPLDQFFAAPKRPDTRAYRDYRQFLLETSQVAGGFYSARGRRQLLRQIVDMMLSAEDPYDALVAGRAQPRIHVPAPDARLWH